MISCSTRGLLLYVILAMLSVPTSGQPRLATHLHQPTPGLFLPVEMRESVRAGKTPVGARIHAQVTQRVPLSPNEYLDRHLKVFGTVITSIAGDAKSGIPSELQVRFDKISYREEEIPMKTDVIAVASMVEVNDTAAPANGSTDRGNPSQANWTTRQVGGDEVYRSGWVGDVYDDVMKKVGFADYYGVYSTALPMPQSQTSLPRAMGVFSTNAKGLYGFERDTVFSSGEGTMCLSSHSHRVSLSGGDNLLLKIVGP